MFQPPPTNPMLDQGTSMSNGIEQETTAELDPENQTPSFSTQVGLDNINVGDEEEHTTQRKGRERWSLEEDKLVIQSWLNISGDAIVRVNQKATSFWTRIRDNYNKYCGNLKEREVAQIKCRWSKLNGMVQKFGGCYKQAYLRKKSGSFEEDIIEDAMAMYQQAEGKHFMLLYAWRMLKNEPKWSNPNEPNKRTKISTSKGYSSSSKPNTPTSGDHIASNSMESNVVRPIGTKAAKRNGKSKANEKVVHIDLTRMEDAQQSKALALKEIARGVHEGNKLKEKELQMKEKDDELKYLFKDTTTMTEEQLQDHKMLCKIIREKYGLV
jgi:hypothetical protein